MVSAPGADDFWNSVRSWQNRGWTIGLHGYQHRYLTNEAGMYGRISRSEFAGLPAEIQEIKLRNALQIFREQQVSPEVWVAPAHSFDSITIAILSRLGIRIISDGYAIYPYQDADGMTWIPQQFGKFRNLPFGVWTICCHFNEWTAAETDRFRRTCESTAALCRGGRCLGVVSGAPPQLVGSGREYAAGIWAPYRPAPSG